MSAIGNNPNVGSVSNLQSSTQVADVKGDFNGTSVAKADVPNQMPEAKQGAGNKSIHDFDSITALSMDEVGSLLKDNQVEMQAIQDTLNKLELDLDAAKDYKLIADLNDSLNEMEKLHSDSVKERDVMIKALFKDSGSPVDDGYMKQNKFVDGLVREIRAGKDSFGSISLCKKASDIIDHIDNKMGGLEKTINETNQKLESEHAKPQELKDALEKAQKKIMEETGKIINYTGDDIIRD